MDIQRSYMIILAVTSVFSFVYLATTWNKCNSHLDCKMGEMCDSNGKCIIDNSCVYDTDCAFGDRCDQSECKVNPTNCESDKDCKDGFYCAGWNCTERNVKNRRL